MATEPLRSLVLAGDRVRPSRDWLRGRFRPTTLTLSADGLTCGDWHLPYAEFERPALLATVPGLPTRLRLMVWHGGRVYQFVVLSTSRWWYRLPAFWAGPLPFAVERGVRRVEAGALLAAMMAFGAAVIAAGLLWR